MVPRFHAYFAQSQPNPFESQLFIDIELLCTTRHFLSSSLVNDTPGRYALRFRTHASCDAQDLVMHAINITTTRSERVQGRWERERERGWSFRGSTPLYRPAATFPPNQGGLFLRHVYVNTLLTLSTKGQLDRLESSRVRGFFFFPFLFHLLRGVVL